jgi:hypothetical protein
MIKAAQTIILVFMCTYTFGQDTTLFLHSWKKTKKVDRITNNMVIRIGLNKATIKPSKALPTSYSGQILSINEDVIIFRIESEELEEITASGVTINSSNTYSIPDSLRVKQNGIRNINSSVFHTYPDSLKKELRLIKMNEINSISMSTENGISNWGGAIAAISTFSALFVAPLVSINYTNGRFNTKRYYSILTGCGIGVAVGLPLNLIFSRDKYYKIKNTVPNPCDNNYYSIQTK